MSCALKAAEGRRALGIDAEVIDLRAAADG